MEPKQPDPIAAARLLQGLPDRAKALDLSFQKACQKEHRFPDWREYQIHWFIRFVKRYSADLGETYRAKRTDALAQAMRNLMELRVWVKYCQLSEQDGKRFFNDGLRDMRDMVQALQNVYAKANKEPLQQIERMLVDMKAKAPGFDVDNFDAPYLKVSDAAAKVGQQDGHVALYKIASKFAHPTAFLLAMEGEGMPGTQGMRDSLFELGAKLADSCITELEKTIREIYGDLGA